MAGVDAARSTCPICLDFARPSMGELGGFDAGEYSGGFAEWKKVGRREGRKEEGKGRKERKMGWDGMGQ